MSSQGIPLLDTFRGERIYKRYEYEVCVREALSPSEYEVLAAALEDTGEDEKKMQKNYKPIGRELELPLFVDCNIIYIYLLLLLFYYISKKSKW